jgi:hypothetical protein
MSAAKQPSTALINSVMKIDLPEILAPFAGGFYMGLLVLEGQLHALIRAPKALGHFISVAWGDFGQRVEGALSFVDGRANTIAMAEAGSELAQKILQLEIDGYKDWVLPARDQLEVMYRNAKPSLHKNFCSYRDGENPSTPVLSMPYTPDLPTQTNEPFFQDGGAEAFDLNWYWSSTQYSADDAYGQDFTGGFQCYLYKDGELRAFAVRMIPVVQ